MAEPGERLVIQTRHLLGREVHGPDGGRAGHVVDLKAIQDGPLRHGATASLRIDGLVVGHHGLAERLGLSRHTVNGPWLLTRLAHIGQPCTYLPWSQIDDPHGLGDTDRPITFTGTLHPLDE